MTDGIYTFATGVSGVSFLVVGLGFLVEPGKERVRRAFGALFLALGSAYVFSYASAFYRLPLPIDNLLVLAIVFAMSQALFEISLYLFGDEAVRGSRRTVYLVGTAWMACLWLLPFLDSVLELAAIGASVEDGRAMGPFQAFSSAALYVWPVVITVLSFRAGRWHAADLPRRPGAAWVFLGAFAGVIAVLALIGISMAASSTVGYQLGHGILQFMMLGWFLYYRANPDAFRRVRKEIELRHEQRTTLGAEDTAAIGERLGRVLASDAIFAVPGLSLAALAKRLRVPAYKLSAYFNAVLGMSFPAWLNARRIERVCGLLVEQPERSILELSLEAGYSSKAVFNSQFRRLLGMSPSEYREKNLR